MYNHIYGKKYLNINTFIEKTPDNQKTTLSKGPAWFFIHEIVLSRKGVNKSLFFYY